LELRAQRRSKNKSRSDMEKTFHDSDKILPMERMAKFMERLALRAGAGRSATAATCYGCAVR
jgi:hypothetical protein